MTNRIRYDPDAAWRINLREIMGWESDRWIPEAGEHVRILPDPHCPFRNSRVHLWGDLKLAVVTGYNLQDPQEHFFYVVLDGSPYNHDGFAFLRNIHELEPYHARDG